MVKRKIKRNSAAEQMCYYDAAELFIQEKTAINLARSSIQHYEITIGMVGNYFDFTEETPANELTLPKFYQFINHLKNEGVAPATIQHYIRTLRVFAYWCMQEDRKYIEEPYKIQIPKAQEEQIKFFNDEEVDLLLEKPKRNASFTEWRNWAMVSWALATGNRASTICDVKLKDIDYGRKEIILHHTKSRRAEIIPLSSALEVVLKEYIRMWRKDADKEDYLFPSVGDEKFNAQALSKSFREYCKNRGIAHSGVHSLRHTFARLWIKNGGNTLQLQKILGHSTLEMTKRYVRLFGEDLKQDFDQYSPLDSLRRKSSRTQTIRRR